MIIKEKEWDRYVVVRDDSVVAMEAYQDGEQRVVKLYTPFFVVTFGSPFPTFIKYERLLAVEVHKGELSLRELEVQWVEVKSIKDVAESVETLTQWVEVKSIKDVA